MRSGAMAWSRPDFPDAAANTRRRPDDIEASTILSAADKHKVYEGNARRVFPRLDAALKAKE